MSKIMSALLGASILCAPVAAQADHNQFHVTVHPVPSPLTAPSPLAREEEMKQTPGAVNLVSSKVFENKFAKSFQETLSQTPGVYAQNRFGEEVRLSIRGSGLSRGFHLRGIELLVDGIPINLADGGGDFQEIDPANAQFIEVYKGANALRFGAATLGGAVNVVTPTARTVDYTNLFRIEGGSFGNIRTHVATAQKDKKWDAYASMTAAHADGFREQSVEDKGRLSANVGYAFNDAAETRFYVTYNNLNQEVPGSVTRQSALNTPRRAPFNNNFNDQQRDIRSVRLANKTAFQINPDTKLEVGAFASSKDLFHPIFQVVDQESSDYGVFSRIDNRFDLFGLSHKLLAGVNYHGGKTDAKQYINTKGSRGNKTADSDQKSQNVVAYGKGQFHVTPTVSAILGGQAMWAKRDFTNNLNVAANDSKTYAEFNPKFGALWDVTPSSQVFANVSRSSEVATFSELVQAPVVGFVPLEPQIAWTSEIGSRGSWRTLMWDVSAYHARITDELLQFTTAPGVPASVFNANETMHQGLEMGGAWKAAQDLFHVNDALVLSQLYNFNDFRFVNDRQFGDNQIAGIPRHLLRTGIKYAREDWSVEPYAEYAPQAPYADFANTVKTTDYFVLNLEAHKQINENLTFFAEGRNLADRKYVSNVSTVVNGAGNPAIFYPGEGRAFYAGLKAKF